MADQGQGATEMAGESLMKAKDVAAWLGVSTAWVASHSNGKRRPQIPSIKLGGCVRFSKPQIQKFLDTYQRSKVA